MRFLKLIIVNALIAFFLFYSCTSGLSDSNVANESPDENNRLQLKGVSKLKDTTFSIDNILVDVIVPDTEIIGQLLMLPGWSYSRKKTCEESSICSLALKKGYILVCPEMGKSIYASKFYPETRKDWLMYPQKSWVVDSLLNFLQINFGLFKEGQANYIFGISTGGRGVALIIENTRTLFKAGAALSGDYDQTQSLNDNLITGYYGNYQKFKSRWEKEDNPLKNASKILVPLYLGHGHDDKIVNMNQSKSFFNELQQINSEIDHELHIADSAGHDYLYWNSEAESVLRFFWKNRK